MWPQREKELFWKGCKGILFSQDRNLEEPWDPNKIHACGSLWKDHKKKAGKTVGKEDFIWIKEIKSSKSCDEESSRNPKSPLQRKDQLSRSFSHPEAPWLHLPGTDRSDTNKRQCQSSKILAHHSSLPVPIYKGIRTHSHVAGVEEQRKKARKWDDKPLLSLYHSTDSPV